MITIVKVMPKFSRASTKDIILKPFIRSSIENKKIGYNFYVFDKRYQKKFTVSQTNRVQFKFSRVVPDGIIGYALVLTNKLVSISSDGQRHFDLI